jgi:hypothetical protein
MVKRRLILIIGISLITLGFGLLWPFEWLSWSFHHLGFYFILISVFLWLIVLFKSCYRNILPFLKKQYPGFVASIIFISLIFTMSPPYFKILADESNLIGTSMSMHNNKTVWIPHQGLNLNYERFKPATVANKRPILYPFAVAIFHSLIGYSANNGFVVNFICGLLILFFFYVFIARFYARDLAILSLFIFAAIPIFSFWITSSGFEGLNLLFIILFFIAYHRFLVTKDAPAAELLFLTFVLLVQCRYESIIFGIMLLILLPRLLRKDMIKQYSPVTFFTPLLIVPILWQRRLFLDLIEPVRMNSDLLKTSGQGFHWQSLWINFSKNIFTLSGLDPNYGFIVIVSVLSIAGAYMLIKEGLTRSGNMASETRYVVFAGTLMFILLFLIYSAYQWGNFNLPISNRLAVVFLPFFVFASIHCIYKIFGPVQLQAKIFLFVFFSLNLVCFWPYAAHQKIIHVLQPSCEYNQVITYFDDRYQTQAEKILLISDRPGQYLIHGYSSIDFEYANDHTAELAGGFNNYFDRIFVLQRCSSATGTPGVNNQLNSAYKLNHTNKVKCSSQSFISILEVLEID